MSSSSSWGIVLRDCLELRVDFRREESRSNRGLEPDLSKFPILFFSFSQHSKTYVSRSVTIALKRYDRAIQNDEYLWVAKMHDTRNDKEYKVMMTMIEKCLLRIGDHCQTIDILNLICLNKIEHIGSNKKNNYERWSWNKLVFDLGEAFGGEGVRR